jgi:hypothetical protein
MPKPITLLEVQVYLRTTPNAESAPSADKLLATYFLSALLEKLGKHYITIDIDDGAGKEV